MRTLLSNLTNTFKAVKLLSNPVFAKTVEQLLVEKEHIHGLGKKNTYFHKYYIVQVVN